MPHRIPIQVNYETLPGFLLLERVHGGAELGPDAPRIADGHANNKSRSSSKPLPEIHSETKLLASAAATSGCSSPKKQAALINSEISDGFQCHHDLPTSLLEFKYDKWGVP